MIVLKVPKKSANKVLEFVKKSSLLDNDFDILKEKDFIFIPLKGKKDVLKKFPSLSFVKKDMPERERKETSLKGLLKGKLSPDELGMLRTAFDVVGSIAIAEIPDELKKKEKIIAEAIMKANKGIKTVLKKSGIHEGTFRTQRLDHVAGEKTKETLHKENGVLLKLDVEQVYFSTRSSTERKRVASMVRPGEDVLVMFSGCAPFVSVISKNSKAGMVYGIELNPVAHDYALENIRLNHLRNAFVLKGDVRKVVPTFYQHILGLKGSMDASQMDPRLEKDPEIFEFHLRDGDLFHRLGILKNKVLALKKKGISVFIHMPVRHEGTILDFGQQDVNAELKIFNILGELCRSLGCSAVVHTTFDDVPKEQLVNNLGRISKFFDVFYFENSTAGIFSKLDGVLEVAHEAGLKNLCIDVSHAFVAYRDNEEVAHFIASLTSEFNTYFHFNDSDGRDDSLHFGSGIVDWEGLLPLVSKGVIEVESRNEENPVELLSSFDLLAGKIRKFDRIVMPLPKSAGDFLDVAFMASKRGTILHFYDFLGKDDIPDVAVKKIEEVAEHLGKKIKIIGHAICGDYSPGVYRVCVDFEVLN